MRVDFTDSSTWNNLVDPQAALASSPYAIALQIGITARGGARQQDEMVADDQWARRYDIFRALAPAHPILGYYVPTALPWRVQYEWIKKQLITRPVDGLYLDIEDGEGYRSMALGWEAHDSLFKALDDLRGRPTAHYGRPFMLRDPDRIHMAAYYGARPGDESMRPLMQKMYAPVGNVMSWQWAGLTGRAPGWGAAIDLNEILDFSLWDHFLGVTEVPIPPWEPPDELLTEPNKPRASFMVTLEHNADNAG